MVTKIIRDNYTHNSRCVTDNTEREELLKQKLREELNEFETSVSFYERINELADIVEVCYAIGGQTYIEEARHKKLIKRGGFALGKVQEDGG